MPKFLLYRIQRMTQNPAAERITPGLEAAAYLHWITCHERDPKKFVAVEPQLPELRQHLAEYLELTARETAAHLEMMAACQTSGREVAGTRDFEAAPTQEAPGRVERINAQFGWNWVLLYWDAAAEGGQPWGYRVYRTDKKSAPVLVATVHEPEALVSEQPERLKLYYYVTAFNAAGETVPSGDLGLMLNAPDEDENEPDDALPDPVTNKASLPNIPEAEMPVRRELGEAMVKFVQKLVATRLGNDEEDSVMRQVATEEYRQAVDKAARQNIEVSLVWHTLAVWTEESRERIGYFARALDCRRAESLSHPPTTTAERWAAVSLEASCLFEIGRVHFHEASPEAARRFLSEALPLAQKADALAAEANVKIEDRLEGRIAELLLKLPDADEP